MKIVIIGGVASGMSAATRLRRLMEHAEITVYEMAEHVSYANCGLPYFVSDVISNRDELLLQTPQSLWSRFKINVKVLSKVIEIDRANRTVTIENLTTGEKLEDRYDKLIIATGAKPRMPQIPGIERALSLRNVTDADQVKAAIETASHNSAVILGAGFIGVELAENLRHLGLEVTLVQRASSVLSMFDPEMVETLQTRLIKHGIKIELNSEATNITAAHVHLSNGQVLDAGLVFAAAGVEPDNTLAKAAGLKIGKTGGLWVNDQQQTSDPDIFAAGDAVEKHGQLTGEQSLVPLANLANRHGRLIADAIVGRPVKAKDALATAIIGAFGISAGITGLSERAAKSANIDHKIIHTHSNQHAGYYPGAKRVSLKVLFDPQTGRILGAQAVGEDGVDKRIDVIATAIQGGLTIDELMDLELAYAPQFGSAKDAINIAGYVGNNVLTGTTPTIQWYELDESRSLGAQIIDVRSPHEHGAGHIPGSINIPVDNLRDRLSEVQLANVVVYCAVGQRGHIATQILKAHDARVRNLDGGYATWSSAMRTIDN
jgi:NADPH-dependent 2,4-dienoyl-CoA reductase/sulfur reductase-like enzyme/rhodanese-related sulfurtransferase